MIAYELTYQARNVDLHEYLKHKGYNMKEIGNRTYIKELPGLVLYGCTYYDFYNDTFGTAIDFATYYLKLDFKTAVFDLLGKMPKTYPARLTHHQKIEKDIIPIKPKKQLTDIIYNKDQHRAWAYLDQRRKIDPKIIRLFLHKGLLKQEKTTGNMIFPWVYKENGIQKIIGAEIVGTCDAKRFKMLLGQQNGCGFIYRAGDQIERFRYFESAIDLMSYLSLKKIDHQCVYISMGGLKPSVVFNFSKGLIKKEHILCTDNDERGKMFLDMIKNECNVYSNIPKKHKDWNECLVAKKSLR